ncbi:MAG: dethiobiotin synthase [Candidatus Omnitrophota bacterium]|nr:dethiobiotin synthase [Candidatus Omnitrophota bacterium]
MPAYKPGIFITGTDTGVGKTVVAAGLAMALKSRGMKVGVMKPVGTGCMEFGKRLICHDSAYLLEAAENEYPPLTSPVRYRHALAPSVAAVLEKREVDLPQIRRSFGELQKNYDFIIVEGIGGLLVPFSKDYFVANLVREFQLPLLIVSKGGLGAINHTLLTIDAAVIRGFEVRGVIFNRMAKTNVSLAEITNPKVIHELSGVPVLGSLPEMDDLDVDTCRYGRLKEIFQERIQVDQIYSVPSLPV